MKVLIFLCLLAVARAGIVATNYSPAATVSTVYSSINPPVVTNTVAAPLVTKTITPITYTKTYTAPAPIYETVLSTHESSAKSLDGTQYNTFAKSLNTPYSSINKFESRTSNGGIFTHSVPTLYSSSVNTVPVQTPAISFPLVKAVSHPVTYINHAQSAPVITKTVSSPSIATYSSPVVTSGLTPYSSHTPVVQAQPAVKITYSEAPLVSHMTFTGLGTSYSW